MILKFLACRAINKTAYGALYNNKSPRPSPMQSVCAADKCSGVRVCVVFTGIHRYSQVFTKSGRAACFVVGSALCALKCRACVPKCCNVRHRFPFSRMLDWLTYLPIRPQIQIMLSNTPKELPRSKASPLRPIVINAALLFIINSL